MAKIEGFRVKNFRALKDVTLGKLWNLQNAAPLTPMTAVIGKNGVGKSTLFDAFGFLADSLKSGVEEACDTRGRGGFDRIRTQGQQGPIELEVYYKEDGNARPITYELAISVDASGRPYVVRERLRQRRKGQKHGHPFSFLMLNSGKGAVWKGEQEGLDEERGDFDLLGFIESIKTGEIKEESKETEVVELDDKRKLGIATLGSLKQHPRISAFRRFIEGWYLSYFTPDASRSLPLAGPQKHLNIHGDNLGNVVQFMEREHPKRFQFILNRIAEKIPGISKIDTEKTNDGRLLLRFNDQGFRDPFYSQQMSDGTLKVFAYLLLLGDPTPPPFLCIEEPENGLYHKLLESLAREFREHATGRKGGSQVFITTHQPYFVDALEPEEVWILEKGSDGYSIIRRASDDEIVKNMVAEGLSLGGLWYSDYLDASSRMHLEILVEDQSGKKALDILVPKIIGNGHTFKVHSYKGIGRIPRNLGGSSGISNRILLDQLPRLLRGYGNTFASYPDDYSAAVILVCDLDDRCIKSFRAELLGILNECNPKPETRFCIAVEEGEAWFLGDLTALKVAYPKAKDAVLQAYKNDSICGTWERLADAVFLGGARALSAKGWSGIGAEKSTWAEKITPHMNWQDNASPASVILLRSSWN